MTDTRDVVVDAGTVRLPGFLAVPAAARGVVVFAHGTGSGRHSPRNRRVAEGLQDAGLATLLLDLLTEEEEAQDVRTAELRFDIGLLAQRVAAATRWVQGQEETEALWPGLFGASTGAAAALVAGVEMEDAVGAIVSRGGRPDLAGDALPRATAPTLLIVGSLDTTVLELNRQAMGRMRAETRLEVVEGASHLFEEPGTLDRVAALAAEWFGLHLGG